MLLDYISDEEQTLLDMSEMQLGEKFGDVKVSPEGKDNNKSHERKVEFNVATPDGRGFSSPLFRVHTPFS